MKITESMCKAYAKYEDFSAEFVKSAMENGSAFLIVNWQDALGVCQCLNTFTINGVSVAMRSEFADEAYEDVKKQKACDGNMLITLFDNGELICEAALDDDTAYVDDVVYYVEYSANEVSLPLHSKMIPFKIESEIFEGVF